MDVLSISGVVAALAVVALVVKQFVGNSKLRKVDSEARRRLDDADRSVKDKLSRAQRDSDQIVRDMRSKMDKERNELNRRNEDKARELNQKLQHSRSLEEEVKVKNQDLQERIQTAKELRGKQEEILDQLMVHLEKASGMTKAEATDVLMANVERDVKVRAGKLIKEVEGKAKKIAARRAKEIVVDSIQKTAVDHVAHATTSVVSLPDDEMKGRIIGREGRNIRSFESATGVDVIIDDTPNGVILSSFDPIRREVARIALDQLVADGRINPSRIDEAVAAARETLAEIIVQKGEEAADEVGLQFHPKLIEMLGKLDYRTSYGQNILRHSLESAHIAGIMAAELGVNIQLAKRGALLHDIGKAIDFEQEGSHDDLGADACRKYDESEEVINCIMAHHEDESPETIEAVIVMVADAISSSRPGARRESVELYVKRLENLEKIASNFDGVEKAYAIQAGREVRVVARPDSIDDEGIHKLAFDIAKRIESEMDYPGEVMVNLVRETRATSIAH